MPVRILIADDHTVFRSGLRALLEKEAEFEIVAEAGNGEETIEAVKSHEVDVLLLDISMPGMSGARVAERVLKLKPDLAIVVLTMHEEICYLRELLGVGVRAYALKKSSGDDLVSAIRAAHRGEQYVDPLMAGQAFSAMVGRSSREQEKRRKKANLLTRRETEVCELLAYGHTNAEIARKLHISERTVESHRNNIMSKLNLKSRAALVRYAIAQGLLKLKH